MKRQKLINILFGVFWSLMFVYVALFYNSIFSVKVQLGILTIILLVELWHINFLEKHIDFQNSMVKRLFKITDKKHLKLNKIGRYIKGKNLKY